MGKDMTIDLILSRLETVATWGRGSPREKLRGWLGELEQAAYERAAKCEDEFKGPISGSPGPLYTAGFVAGVKAMAKAIHALGEETAG